MEQFGNLSLDDEFDQKLREDDPIGISNLKISDNGQKMSPQVLSRYMPHFPALPSPLRNSFSFVEMHGDQMEIDECEDEGRVREDTNNDKPIEEEINKKNAKVTFLMPTRVNGIAFEKEEEKLSETVEEVKEGENGDLQGEVDQHEGANSTAVIKALLSPTSLGVAAATKIDGIPLSDSDLCREAIPTEEIVENIESSSFDDFDVRSIKQDLRSRSKHQPIHVSINNHHYYYPDSSMHRSGEAHLQDQNDQSHRGKAVQPLIHEDGRYELPLPWSSKSRPISRGSYAFMSYLQLVLNAITVTAIFSVILSFFRTLQMDIKSTWDHRRSELAYESSRCKSLYLTNKCNLQGRPALQEQCQAWEQCMNRNNDIFFRARSTLTAQLFGEIINSFIEPIGWKALLVISMGTIVWCFCSNFLLGFARAKSYYGDASQQALMHQQLLCFEKEEPSSRNLIKKSRIR